MSLLPLDSLRRELGYNPLHFWGMAGTTGRARVSSSCNQVLKEYAWQDADAIGRDELRMAIETAEERLRQYLGYAVAPRYTTQTLPFPGAGDAWGRWPSVALNDGSVQSVGVETRALIQAAVPVVYTDADQDGINDTATITVATTVTDTDQLLAFFSAADRYDGTTIPATGSLGDAERFQIRTLKVVIASGLATITAPAWLFVRPVRYQGVDTTALDPTSAATYAASVDIYRRYVNPDGITTDTAQATLIWETTPCGGWWCCAGDGVTWTDSSTDPAAQGYAIARAGIRDARLGIVAAGPAAYDAAAGTWGEIAYGTCRAPDRITVRYRAGLPLVGGQMQRHMQVIVARMAIAEMERPIGACADSAGRVRHRWQYDLAQSSGNNDEAYGAVSSADLDNPYGTRRGHVFAWRETRNLRLLPGFLP